jgi:hypothetical protein
LLSEGTEGKEIKPEGFILALQGAPKGITASNPSLSAKYCLR